MVWVLKPLRVKGNILTAESDSTTRLLYALHLQGSFLLQGKVSTVISFVSPGDCDQDEDCLVPFWIGWRTSFVPWIRLQIFHEKSKPHRSTDHMMKTRITGDQFKCGVLSFFLQLFHGETYVGFFKTGLLKVGWVLEHKLLPGTTSRHTETFYSRSYSDILPVPV